MTSPDQAEHAAPDEVFATLGTAVLEEALIAVALSGGSEASLRVEVATADQPDQLRVLLHRTGKTPLEVVVNVARAGS